MEKKSWKGSFTLKETSALYQATGKCGAYVDSDLNKHTINIKPMMKCRVQNKPVPNMPFLHEDSFELKAIAILQVQNKLLPLP